MAIKGKKKGKGGKPRAAAPRAVPVVPSVPLFRRKGLQLGLASIASLILGLGLGYGFGKDAASRQPEVRIGTTIAAARALQNRLEDALKDVGPPTEGPTFIVFPDLPTAIKEARDGNPEPADNVAFAAASAAEKVSAIMTPPPGAVDPAAAEQIANTKRNLLGALALYQRSAAAAVEAAAAPDSGKAEELLVQSSQLMEQASSKFETAYASYHSLLVGTGIAQAASPPPQGGEGVIPPVDGSNQAPIPVGATP